ncbi:DUF6527 family protein [Desulfovibrio aminophilus]|uniref:DUF6527 family protein n=1 Tax=Desulfovibrio aminophilus TaxID=81425 RepID=UPI0033996CD5
MRYKRLEHRFVEYIPEKLEPGVLYISMEYATAAHSCCCGCGEEVVTPFTPTDWKMTFDGETVSLNPSIGNWNLPCRSHYVIDRGKVIMARPWTNKQIEAERRRDRIAKAKFYGQAPVDQPSDDSPIIPIQRPEVLSLWCRVWNWIIRKR